jgi:hypothetical protein
MNNNELYCVRSSAFRQCCGPEFRRSLIGDNKHFIWLTYYPEKDMLELYEHIIEFTVERYPYDRRKRMSSSYTVKHNTTVLYHPVMEDYADCLSVDDVKRAMYKGKL